MTPFSREQLEELARKKMTGRISPEENKLLLEWLDWDSREQEGSAFENLSPEIRSRIFGRLEASMLISKKQRLTHRIGRSIRWVAAALILITAGIWFFTGDKEENKELAQTNTWIDLPAPAANQAYIQLEDGRVLQIDSLPSGIVKSNKDVNIIRDQEGNITYVPTSSDEANANAVSLNTLVNPRGSLVAHLQLADGTLVWLNSGSSLTYPTQFLGNERRVTITGEAYFEVAHNKEKPFSVSNNNLVVQVLGTHFNFNAYDDETSHRVTLLEGKVRVNADNKTIELMPGQQSLYKPNAQHPSSLSKLYDADLEAVMAWKNGEFRLKNVSILELLKQASRWYDVDFVFEFEPEKTNFTGILSRKENVSKLLEVLTATQKVAFRKEGRRIVVIKPLNNEN